jgi:hypothetical protein
MPNRAGRLAIAILLTLAHTAVLDRFGGLSRFVDLTEFLI